ncbi:hypothetical protein [Thermotalea metallivorans]|uniref:Uncharacterized protein n=1 Tax=Thermotalea metallivorans TaxID=520762 RepID=A0A140L7D1_9FIRM|nr:hypothetical protein [Thermotalea metallivorans]KXG76456.1 hypothetical protein AN619_09870 [Thermotalea metallivorans]
MDDFRIGVLPCTPQPKNCDFDIKEMYDRLINLFDLDVKKYYLFDLKNAHNLFKIESKEFDKSFRDEVYPLFIKIRTSDNEIGDRTPLFLISYDKKEIIQLTERANGKCILKKYYKINDSWEFFYLEK